jgi:hypothetical protein
VGAQTSYLTNGVITEWPCAICRRPVHRSGVGDRTKGLRPVQTLAEEYGKLLYIMMLYRIESELITDQARVAELLSFVVA